MKPVVEQTYTRASKEAVPGLCCPPSYDPKYLSIIPSEVLERDYGCGDPTPYVRAGDTVVDLGSGSGKMVFILAQIVGSEGRAIGIDANASMMELSRNAGPIVSLRMGCRNMAFKRAAIEDIDLDLDAVERHLKSKRINGVSDLLEFEQFKRDLKLNEPTISDSSVDVVLSNCVINLIDASERKNVFATVFRKLKPGGRIAISDIVCDSKVPPEIANDPQLHADCVSGAFDVSEFTTLLEDVGFVGIRIDAVSDTWQKIQNVTFRSMTFVASKPHNSAQTERVSATYRGPWKRVEDDAGNVFLRGHPRDITSADLESLCFGSPDAELLRSDNEGTGITGSITRYPKEQKRCC